MRSLALWVLPVGLALYHGTFLIWEQDIFWQLRAGSELLLTGQLPYVDEWSYTSRGRAWLNVQWLSTVFFALAHRLLCRGADHFGPLILLRAILIAVLLAQTGHIAALAADSYACATSVADQGAAFGAEGAAAAGSTGASVVGAGTRNAKGKRAPAVAATVGPAAVLPRLLPPVGWREVRGGCNEAEGACAALLASARYRTARRWLTTWAAQALFLYASLHRLQLRSETLSFCAFAAIWQAWLLPGLAARTRHLAAISAVVLSGQLHAGTSPFAVGAAVCCALCMPSAGERLSCRLGWAGAAGAAWLATPYHYRIVRIQWVHLRYALYNKLANPDHQPLDAKAWAAGWPYALCALLCAALLGSLGLLASRCVRHAAARPATRSAAAFGGVPLQLCALCVLVAMTVDRVRCAPYAAAFALPLAAFACCWCSDALLLLLCTAGRWLAPGVLARARRPAQPAECAGATGCAGSAHPAGGRARANGGANGGAAAIMAAGGTARRSARPDRETVTLLGLAVLCALAAWGTLQLGLSSSGSGGGSSSGSGGGGGSGGSGGTHARTGEAVSGGSLFARGVGSWWPFWPEQPAGEYSPDKRSPSEMSPGELAHAVLYTFGPDFPRICAEAMLEEPPSGAWLAGALWHKGSGWLLPEADAGLELMWGSGQEGAGVGAAAGTTAGSGSASNGLGILRGGHGGAAPAGMPSACRRLAIERLPLGWRLLGRAATSWARLRQRVAGRGLNEGSFPVGCVDFLRTVSGLPRAGGDLRLANAALGWAPDAAKAAGVPLASPDGPPLAPGARPPFARRNSGKKRSNETYLEPNLYHGFTYGHYLTWNNPEYPVFADTREVMFHWLQDRITAAYKSPAELAANLHRWSARANLSPIPRTEYIPQVGGWRDLLAEYTPREDWALVCFDHVAILQLERRRRPHAGIVRNFEYAQLRPYLPPSNFPMRKRRGGEHAQAEAARDAEFLRELERCRRAMPLHAWCRAAEGAWVRRAHADNARAVGAAVLLLQEVQPKLVVPHQMAWIQEEHVRLRQLELALLQRDVALSQP